jgi:hypothetical protein
MGSKAQLRSMPSTRKTAETRIQIIGTGGSVDQGLVLVTVLAGGQADTVAGCPVRAHVLKAGQQFRIMTDHDIQPIPDTATTCMAVQHPLVPLEQEGPLGGVLPFPGATRNPLQEGSCVKSRLSCRPRSPGP